MKLKFIPAAELKNTFKVFGHFYSICLNSGEQIECRSVLEIVTKNDVGLLSSEDPDAIFVLMNPGSSEPLKKVNDSISEASVNRLVVSLVPTKPDITQYQVMRVMHYCSWNHVRVLNISDMRDPKSGKFIEHYKDIEERIGFTAHSLFDDERGKELKCKLRKKSGAPIVCAWGVSSDLDPLIKRCWNKLAGMPGLTGLLKPSTKNKYFHPLPTLQVDKENWVNKMSYLIENVIAVN